MLGGTDTTPGRQTARWSCLGLKEAWKRPHSGTSLDERSVSGRAASAAAPDHETDRRPWSKVIKSEHETWPGPVSRAGQNAAP